MGSLYSDVGFFIWPLGLCSVLALVIIVERMLALRAANVLPQELVDRFVKGDLDALPASERTLGGRIVGFFQKNEPDPEALKAYAALETAKLERGLFILDIVVAAAPLLGLLGTVTGLIRVFSGMDTTGGMPDPGDFSQGIAMALSTTMLGLAIAIPALVGNTYLNRKIDLFAAQIDVGVERLVDLAYKRAEGAQTAQTPKA